MHTVVARVRNLLPDAPPPYDMALNISQNGNVCYDTMDLMPVSTLRFMDYVVGRLQAQDRRLQEMEDERQTETKAQDKRLEDARLEMKHKMEREILEMEKQMERERLEMEHKVHKEVRSLEAKMEIMRDKTPPRTEAQLEERRRVEEQQRKADIDRSVQVAVAAALANTSLARDTMNGKGTPRKRKSTDATTAEGPSSKRKKVPNVITQPKLTCCHEGCAYTCSNPTTLRTHKMRKHVVGRTTCTICQNTFADSYNMDRHVCGDATSV
jgi:hypothetical protein